MLSLLEDTRLGIKGSDSFLTGPSSLLKAVSSLLISSHPSVILLIFKCVSKGKYTWCCMRLEWLPARCLPQCWDRDGKGNDSNSAGETSGVFFPLPSSDRKAAFFLNCDGISHLSTLIDHKSKKCCVFRFWNSTCCCCFAVSGVSSGHCQCSLDRLCTGSQDLLWVEPGGWTRLGKITACYSDCGSQALFASPLCAQEIFL